VTKKAYKPNVQVPLPIARALRHTTNCLLQHHSPSTKQQVS